MLNHNTVFPEPHPASRLSLTRRRLIIAAGCAVVLAGFKFGRNEPGTATMPEERPQTEEERRAAAWERFHYAQLDTKIEYTSETMRTLVVGLESYAIDNHGRYPVHTSVLTNSALRQPEGLTGVPGLLRRTWSGGPATLVKPFAYIDTYDEDPFAAHEGDGFAYYTTTTLAGKHGYIIFSAGPDANFSLPWELYDPALKGRRRRCGSIILTRPTA